MWYAKIRASDLLKKYNIERKRYLLSKLDNYTNVRVRYIKAEAFSKYK